MHRVWLTGWQPVVAGVKIHLGHVHRGKVVTVVIRIARAPAARLGTW